MTLRSRLIIFAVSVAIVAGPRSGAATLPANERVPVSQQNVAYALAASHVVVDSTQVQLLSEATTKSAVPMLKVTRVEKWSENSALARIRCARSSECMPFYVVVHWPTSHDRDIALAPPASRDQAVFVSARQEPLVRAGEQALLITNTDKFHATTPIICLQSGGQGQKVRVATLNRKKIAMAEVIDNGVLKGSFSAE